MLKYYLAVCILIALFIISCAGSIPVPTYEQSQWAANKWPGTNISELSEGRQLFIEKCSGCHGLKNPSKYTEEEWNPIMKKMGKKAKLNESEFEKISRFVITLSKR